MFFDLALAYDPAVGGCDLVIADDGDLLVDETPVTPMLLSLGLDRRAAVDDPLPQGRTLQLMAHFSARRGWAGDALDPKGERVGSKLWLLDRAKQTETTRQLFEFWLAEALAWAEAETGRKAEIEVEWIRPATLAYRVMIDDTQLAVQGAR